MNNIKDICPSLEIKGSDAYFAGVNISSLAEKYGTPLYLMDEDRIRQNCRRYISAVRKSFGENAGVLFASKAASFKRIYEIIESEGLGTDVVSSGEIYSALNARFDMSNAFFHSNNKTDSDIEYGIESGVGYFVCDGEDELLAVDRIAAEKGKVQNVLLRITPGIDPHTFEAVATGKVDSKFGSAVETGQAFELAEKALNLENIRLCGFHCHLGSQIFDEKVYLDGTEIMLNFISEVKKKTGFEAEILDIGGGLGVRYTEDDPIIDIPEIIGKIAAFMKNKAACLGITFPKIYLEPGRSIVADAGITVYTAGSIKRIPGYRNYISVDGGMTDNIRFALYGSKYTIIPAEKMSDDFDGIFSVVGRCCESGDIIGENIPLPQTMKRGDLLVTLVTGAYNYSMASNYNKIGRPPIVMLSCGKDYIAVRRESFEDLASHDL